MSAPAQRLVSLGSSFGAGPGLRPRVSGSPRAAGRSEINAAHLVARRAGIPLVDVTFSGATVAQIRTGGPGNVEPQLASVRPETTLVTITAGGNDVVYLPALTLSSLPRALTRTAFRGRIARLIDRGETDRRFARLESELRMLVEDIGVTAPSARIMIIGYLTILPPVGAAHRPLPGAVATWGRTVAHRLAQTQATVAAATGAEFIDAGAESVEHHTWSAEPWTHRFHLGLRGGAPYHPTPAGMEAVARMLAERIRTPR